MIVNKLEPFYTDQEREEKNKILLRDTFQILQAETETERTNTLGVLLDRLYLLEAEVERRYIESFNGDIDAIVKDAEEIIEAISKKDYLKEQTEITKRLKEGPLKSVPDKNSTLAEKAAYRNAKARATRGYNRCRHFILLNVIHQLNAAAKYGSTDGQMRIIAIAEEKAATFYKKPAERLDRKKNSETLPAQTEFLPVPTSPATSLFFNLLTYGGDVEQIARRKNHINKTRQYTAAASNSARSISSHNKKTEATLEISLETIQKLRLSKNPQLEKIFMRILIEAGHQSFRNGGIINDKITFSLDCLVGEGQYSSIEAARHGIYNATPALMGILARGKITRGKRNTITQAKARTLFTAIDIDNNICQVRLNPEPDMEWGTICAFYTFIPDFYFELSRRSANLLRYIFFLARQNAKSIKETGYFTISFQAIHTELALPDVGKTKNPKRDIKDVISDAIEEIEEKYSRSVQSTPEAKRRQPAEPDFSLLPVKDHGQPIDETTDYNMPITEYLKKCKLRVSFKNEYAKSFVEMAERTAKKQRETERRVNARKGKTTEQNISNISAGGQ